MKGIAFLFGLLGGLITLGIILLAPAQITSDGTTNTTVTSSDNNFNILNGIQKGNNLFHSFREFSIPTGSSAHLYKWVCLHYLCHCSRGLKQSPPSCVSRSKAEREACPKGLCFVSRSLLRGQRGNPTRNDKCTINFA